MKLPQVSTAFMLASMAQRAMAQEVVPQTTPAYNALEDPEVVTSYVLSYLLYGTPVLIFFCCLCCEIKNRCCGLFRNDRNTPLTGVVLGGQHPLPSAPSLPIRTGEPRRTDLVLAAQAPARSGLPIAEFGLDPEGSPGFVIIGTPLSPAALALSAPQNPAVIEYSSAPV